MGDKVRKLCKWKKGEYKEKLDELCLLIADPKYVCKRCGRASNEKKALCDPAKVND